MRHRFLPLTIFFAITVAFASIGLSAKTVYPALTGRLVDQANVIDARQKAAINKRLSQIEKATGHQVVVATIATLGDEDVESYAVGLGRAWGIGNQDLDDGLLLIVAMKERKIRIEIGPGLQGVFTDANASSVIRNKMGPRLKTGNVAAGISDGLDAIALYIGPDTPERAALLQREEANAKLRRANAWAGFVKFLGWCATIIGTGIAGYIVYRIATAKRRRLAREQRDAADARVHDETALLFKSIEDRQAERDRQIDALVAEHLRRRADMIARETPAEQQARVAAEAIAASAAVQSARGNDDARENNDSPAFGAGSSGPTSSSDTTFSGGGGSFDGGGASGSF